MNSRQKQYWEYIRPQVQRLYSQFDSRPFSKTYGCFDRRYWHHRTSDFPSSSLQQGVAAFAQLYKLTINGTYEEDPEFLMESICAAVDFTAKIQKRDGSFDEWYYNERGWAGPTAYILNSLFQVQDSCQDFLPKKTTDKIASIFLRAEKHLAHFEETDVLSNHQALAMLALYQSFLLNKSSFALDSYQKLKERFFKSFIGDEGWSLEYDGPDPGYQTATLAFLAQIHELSQDSDLENLAKKQLEFIGYFAFPDDSFAMNLGSRSTEVVFHYGLEYWSTKIPIAKKLSHIFLSSLIKGKILGPHQQEDHYFIYRITELIQSLQMATCNGDDNELPQLPFEKENFQRAFKNGKLLLFKHESLYGVINYGQGGRGLIFDCKQKKKIKTLGDFFVETEAGNWLSTGGCKGQVTTSEKNTEFSIKTPLKKFRSPVFTPFSSFLFKIVSFVVFSPRLAKRLKTSIRSWLMYSPTTNEQHFAQRIIKISDSSCDVEVTFSHDFKQIFETWGISSRHVPQANYFLKSPYKNILPKKEKI